MVQEVWLYYKVIIKPMKVKEKYKAAVIEYSSKAENMSKKSKKKLMRC